MMLHKIKKIIASGLFLNSFMAGAVIHFDLEKDPIPVVDLTVVVPYGTQTQTPEESGLALVTQEILSAGTISLDKQAFNDELAKYGIEYSFSVGNHYSYWSIKFPFDDKKDYSPIIKILSENWNQPRFLQKDFDLALLKVESGFRSSLDSDSSLLSTAFRNFLNAKYLAGFPVYVDELRKNATLSATNNFFRNRFHSTKDLWAGAVAPEQSKKLIKQIVEGVFKSQGSLNPGILKKSLESGALAKNNIRNDKLFLLIDRKGREQTIMGFIGLSPELLTKGKELEFFFSDYLLFSSGLDSFYLSVIRGEKGLAYTASSIMTQYRDFKTLSFLTNPQSSKVVEAFSTLSTLMNSTLSNSKNLSIIDESRWLRSVNSFRNSKALENALPDHRLSNRMSVVTNSQTYDFAISNPEKWMINRTNTAEHIQDLWVNSTKVVGAVGSQATLTPLIKKYFPDYQIKVIPYKEVINSKPYR